jgi:hypothetical protein
VDKMGIRAETGMSCRPADRDGCLSSADVPGFAPTMFGSAFGTATFFAQVNLVNGSRGFAKLRGEPCTYRQLTPFLPSPP